MGKLAIALLLVMLISHVVWSIAYSNKPWKNVLRGMFENGRVWAIAVLLVASAVWEFGRWMHWWGE